MSVAELLRGGIDHLGPMRAKLRATFEDDARGCPSISCREMGWPCRRLPDGSRLHLWSMIFNVRLSVSSPIDAADDGSTDGWCFDRTNVMDAVIAFITWDGQGDPPGRWKKHVTTGRRGRGATGAAID